MTVMGSTGGLSGLVEPRMGQRYCTYSDGMGCMKPSACCKGCTHVLVMHPWLICATFSCCAHSAQAAVVYGSEFLCPKNVVWGKCGKTGLCRYKQQANCVDTPECPPSPTESDAEGSGVIETAGNVKTMSGRKEGAHKFSAQH